MMEWKKWIKENEYKITMFYWKCGIIDNKNDQVFTTLVELLPILDVYQVGWKIAEIYHTKYCRHVTIFSGYIQSWFLKKLVYNN